MEGYRHEFSQKILDSGLLMEEDYEYISMNHEDQKMRYRVPAAEPYKRLPSVFFSFIVPFTSIFVTYLKTSSYWLTAVSFFIFFFSKYVIEVLTARFKDPFTKPLDDYLQSNREFQSAITKSLRFIQEMEIAAMGYTLVSGKTQVNRLIKTRQRIMTECIHLRHQVLKSCVVVILNIREAASLILNLQGADVKLKLNISLCQIPLDELGPCFDKDKTFEDLSEATYNFCLDVLRDTVQFMCALRSEFLKVLSTVTTKGNCIDASKMLKLITALCKGETERLTEVYKSHQNVQNLQKNVLHNASMKDGITIRKTPIFTAVHSAQVHLRAALQVAIESEECLENVSEDYVKGIANSLYMIEGSLAVMGKCSLCLLPGLLALIS